MANNGLSVSVNAFLDTSQVYKTYNELQQSVSRKKLELPLDVKIDKIVPKLDNVLNNKVGRMVDDSFNRINTKVQNLSKTVMKEFEKTAKDGSVTKVLKPVTEHFTKVTETFKNAIGDVQERVSIWDENNKYLASSLQTVKHGVETITKDTTSFYQVIDNVQTKVTEVSKTITDTSGAEQTIIERTKEWTDANGRLHQTIETIDADGNKLKPTVENISTTLKVLTTETHEWTNSSGEVNKWTTTFNNAGNRITTKVKQAVNDMNELVTTTRTAINGRNVGEATVQITEFAEAVNTTTKTARGTIEDLGHSYEGLITTTERVGTNGEYLRTVISKYVNEMGQAVERTEQFNKAGVKVATTMRQISDASAQNTETKIWVDKDGVKTVEQYLNGVLQLTTRTREYINENKELVKETTQLEGVNRRLISSHVERSRNIQQETQALNEEVDATFRLREERKRLDETLVSTTTTHSRGTTTQFGTTDGRQYEALVTTIERVNAANQKAIETTYEFTNAQGQLVRQTRTTDAEGKKLAEDTIQISDASERASQGVRDLGTATRQTAMHTKTLGESLSGAISRLARYYVASLPIRAVRVAIQETIQTIKEFDSALIEFRKVSDLAGDSLTRYVAKLAEMGEITGSTMQAMVEASTEFRKSGFGDEDSAKLASVAEMYRNIADEEISAGESASFIIAQMKAFNIEAEGAEHIIDAVNEVANNFSVSSADLAKNLGNMSAIMAINNVSMEQQIGMLTGVTEITRNASSASRGLVMISSRLTQVLDDSSSTGKKLTKIYNDLGIELKDESGQLRSHYDILSELAGKWDSLSENQQKYIALTSAGARQQQNFVALMDNWKNVAEATSKAYGSLGSAQKENEKVMDSVAKKVEILKSQFQQLVIGKGGLQDFAKSILNIGITLLKFANTDIAKAIFAFIALESAVLAVRKAWIALQTVSSTNILASAITSLIAGETTLAQVTTVLTRKFYENAVAWAATPMGQVSIAIAAIVAIVYACHKLSVAFDDATESTQKLAEESKQTESEIENLNNELDNIKQKLQDLKNQKLEITDPSQLSKLQNETNELKRQEAVLKRQLALKLALLEKEHAEETESAKSALNTPIASKIKQGETHGNYTTSAHVTPTEELDLVTDRYKYLKEQVNSLNEVLSHQEQLYGNQSNQYLDTAKKIETLEKQEKELADYGTELAEGIKTNADSLYGQDDATIKLKQDSYASVDSFLTVIGVMEQAEEQINDTTLSEEELAEEAEKLADIYENFADSLGVSIEDAQQILDDFAERTGLSIEEADEAIKNFAKNLGISESALFANADAMGLNIEKYYEYAMAVKASDEALDGLQSAYDTLSSAIDEYNESQVFSLDTVQALLNLQPQYLSMLVEENGQLSLNEEAMMNVARALIEERKQLVINTAMERLKELESKNVTDAANTQAEAVYGSSDALKDESKSLSENTVQQYANALARDDRRKQADAAHIVNEMYKELDILKKIGDSVGSLGSAGAKSGAKRAGGSKQATDALKEENKELTELKSKYDKVITFITGRIDKRVKAIQKEKEAEVKAIEEVIKAREKEKDKALDAIEKQIDALEKEKEAREKYWDEQIDALKKANDERKEALELQEKLDALEKAKNTKVKVYKEGQGFVYDVDQTKVAEAQKALDEYLSEKAYEDELERLNALKDAEIDNYKKRIDALNDYKDRVQESYEKQLEALKEHKEALEEQYDAQIEYYNNYKEQFEEMVKAYEDKQTELLASQLTGIDFENDNWMTRLDNLAKFVNEYNRLQEQLNTGNTSNANTAELSSGGELPKGSPTPSSPSTTTPTKNAVDVTYMSPSERERLAREGNKTVMGKSNPEYKAKILHQKVTTHASGIGSISDNEIAIVGENPNQELVIGSKINNGQLMSLKKGTGVVNAESSNTLASMLNQVGKFGSSGFGSGNGTLNNNINNDSLVVNGVTIQGANISDPQTFVNGLLNLKAEALQRAYRHR